MRVAWFVVLASLGPGAGCAGAATERMAPFARSGFVLAGAEYWPYHGDQPLKYPDDVLWGFYPEKGVIPPGETEPNPASARPVAIACAWRAWRALRAFVDAAPPELRQIVERGAGAGITAKFYLWTNDYGEARDPYIEPVRPARLWYWKRGTPVAGKPPGYWKWESTVDQRGRCTIPEASQIKAYLEQQGRELR